MSEADVFDALAAVLAPRVAEILRGADTTLISQAESPLGPRRHCAAVRARIARGALGASIVGRQFFLTRAALDEEIALRGGRPAKTSAPKPVDVMAELARRFPLQRAAV